MTPEIAYQLGVRHAISGKSLDVSECGEFHKELASYVKGKRNPAGVFVELKNSFEKGYADFIGNQERYSGNNDVF